MNTHLLNWKYNNILTKSLDLLLLYTQHQDHLIF